MSDATGSERPRRVGRPQKVDDNGVPTRDRLLAAATAACVERGFEGITLSDVARRAGVSTPAVYKHFASKSELLVEACRVALDRLRPPVPDARRDPTVIARRYPAPDFADARVLQTELHLASLRHDDVRGLLAKWHGDNASSWTGGGAVELPTVKTWYLLLLGLAQLDSLGSLAADPDAVEREVTRLVTLLFGA